MLALAEPAALIPFREPRLMRGRPGAASPSDVRMHPHLMAARIALLGRPTGPRQTAGDGHSVPVCGAVYRRSVRRYGLLRSMTIALVIEILLSSGGRSPPR